MKNHQLRASILAAAVLAAGFLTACSSQTAEEKGKELATGKIDMAKGIGVALQEKGEAASEAVTGGVGKVFRGIEKGVSQSGRAIAADASIGAAGLKITTLQDSGPDKEGQVHAIDAYIVSTGDASGKLRVTAFDVLDREIARTSIDLKKPADEGKYHAIPLDAQLKLSSISKVAFTFIPSSPAGKKAP
jgi:hypothetical protein